MGEVLRLNKDGKWIKLFPMDPVENTGVYLQSYFTEGTYLSYSSVIFKAFLKYKEAMKYRFDLEQPQFKTIQC